MELECKKVRTYRLIIVFSVPDARPIDVSAVLSYKKSNTNNPPSAIQSLFPPLRITFPIPFVRCKAYSPYSSNSQSAPSAPSTPSTHPHPVPPSPALSSDSPAVSSSRLLESRCRRVSERGRNRRVRRKWECRRGERREGRSYVLFVCGVVGYAWVNMEGRTLLRKEVARKSIYGVE